MKYNYHSLQNTEYITIVNELIMKTKTINYGKKKWNVNFFVGTDGVWHASKLIIMIVNVIMCLFVGFLLAVDPQWNLIVKFSSLSKEKLVIAVLTFSYAGIPLLITFNKYDVLYLLHRGRYLWCDKWHVKET